MTGLRAIFERHGTRYVPTEAALGPWTEDALHGGPPTMLLAYAIERFSADHPMFVVRMTVELLHGVGREPLSIRRRLLRPGRNVQIIEASLWSDGRAVARATALRIRRSDVAVPPDGGRPPRDLPDTAVPWPAGYRSAPAYHLLGVEARSSARPRVTRGPGWAWFRMKLPLLPHEEPSGLIRVCAAADFASGISNVVDPARLSYINADLTISVHRLPSDDWVLVDARTWLAPNGTGVAAGRLYDRRGPIAFTLQSLLVRPR